MEMRSRADEYIGRNRCRRQERPAFHVTPPVGWLNDPNGFSVYGDQIHLFYQFYPYEPKWGPMHWGHQVTEDLIRWTDCPTALAPDCTYDQYGCFSGSAVETEEGHVLIYTGVTKELMEDGTEVEYQNQCIAVGDGITYEKDGQNPVLCGSLLPQGFSRKDFRDPKVWREDGIYYLVAGSRDENGNGQVVLCSSENLKSWKYEGVIAHNDGTIGKMWECPDFFSLDGRQILICSPQNMRASGYEFHNGHNSLYFLGDYSQSDHVFQKGEPVSLDYGLDFYAPQTVLLPDGRRIMIGWMQSWDTVLIPDGQAWNGMMTLPRELSVRDDVVIQSPVRELERYRVSRVALQDQRISGTCRLPGIGGRCLDLTVKLGAGTYREFCMDVAHNEHYTTSYTYQADRQLITVDRTYSGIDRDMVCQRTMKVRNPKRPLSLRFIMDRNSIELFVNDGEQVSSTVIFTPEEADEILFSCDGEVSVDVEQYEICVE